RYLAANKRFDEALAEIDRAIELDPVSPMQRAVRGWVLHFAGRDPAALDQCREVVSDYPNFSPAHAFLGYTLEHIEDYASAIEAFSAAVRDDNSPTARASLAHAYARSGDAANARDLLAELEAQASSWRRGFRKSHVVDGSSEIDLGVSESRYVSP